MNHTTALRG